MPKPPQNTSVSSLFISLSLTEGQFTFILPPFKLLTFILSLFFFVFFFICWFYEPALLTGKEKGPTFDDI